MPQDLKYGTITVEREPPSGPIPVDEPVFMFRAQDELAAQVLTFYRNLLRTHGIFHLVQGTQRAMELFEAWPAKKMPD